MTLDDALAELQHLGTAQNRKIYQRHGVLGDQYGVSYGNQNTLKKKIKVDHDLAQQLWATGNHDARILATMIADPNQADAALLDAWAADLDCYVLADALATFAGKTSLVHEQMPRWIRSDDEWIGRAGWHLVTHLAKNDDTLPDSFFEELLNVIERDIHAAKNKTRDAMNSALIAIGIRNAALEAKAVAAAERIGPVDVDHGETSCKTPAAVPYIRKARQRKRKG